MNTQGEGATLTDEERAEVVALIERELRPMLARRMTKAENARYNHLAEARDKLTAGDGGEDV